MRTAIKRTLKRAPFYSAYLRVRDWRNYLAWILDGRCGPAPKLYKQRRVRSLAKERNLRILVETGTYLGEMVSACARSFEQIYSIELSDTLHAMATTLFSKEPHIHLSHGNSADLLPLVLSQLRDPILFWLDAHYSQGITSRGPEETPILSELKACFQNMNQNSVILIDDARCFTGYGGYPHVSDIEAFAAQNGFRCSVHADIIQLEQLR